MGPRWYSAGLAALLLTMTFPTLFACTWVEQIWAMRGDRAEPLFPFQRDRKTGYIDASGKVVIPPMLMRSGFGSDEFHEGLLAIGRGEYIDRTGTVVLRTTPGAYRDFSEGLAVFASGSALSSWGFVDRTGQLAIPARFRFADDFSEGLAMVEVSREVGSTGYINHQGEFVVPPRLTYGSRFMEGLAAVVIDGPCRMTNGGSCQRPQFEPTESPATYSCRFSFIDRNGRPVSDQRFDDAKDFSEGLAAVRIGGQWGYADKAGYIAIPAEFEQARSFSQGMAAVRRNGKMGFIDRTGRLVIAPQFDFAGEFYDGRALVWSQSGAIESTYRFINTSGEPAFPDTFVLATSFRHGLAHVARRGAGARAYEWIDTAGKTVFGPSER